MTSALPDPDWYLDHVVLAGRSGAVVGPAAAWRAEWAARARELTNAPVDGAMRAVTERALRQGFVVSRVQLRACGMPDASVRRLIRRGKWSVAGRGSVALVPPNPETGLVVAASAAAFSRAGHVISHRSAGLLHGLPLIDRPGTPELTTLVRVALGTRPAALVRSGGLDEDEVIAWFGLPVTTVARTITDLTRQDRAAGLVAADAALRERLVTPSELVDAAGRCAGWPGARAARDVVALASPLAESPLESLTRLGLVDAGLPEP